MPKNKADSQKTFTSTSAASASPSSAISRVGIFNPNEEKSMTLSDLPDDVLEKITSYLENKDLIALVQVDKERRQEYYPSLKTAMVKVLKELVDRDDTVRVKQLLRVNPNLQLRKDEWDLEGKAYQNIETTPYQDTLADVMQEEMRTLLEESFPSKEKEEKLAQKEKLGHAAIQAEEFKQPRFDQLREEKRKIMKELTPFAYKTYESRYNAWAETNYDNAHIQPVRDAWMRVDLIQNQWPKRFRKIFSVVNMDEKQTFENLPRDLPEPHFCGDPNDRWLPGTVKGCDLRLMSVPEDQDLSAADFRANLRATADGYPVLIRQGEEEEATYHLCAPHIYLDEDKSEWPVVPIDPVHDKAVIELIKWGRPPPYSEVAEAVDFNQQALPYNLAFNDLYRFGSQRALHLGSGSSNIFAAYNYGARLALPRGVRDGGRALKNFAAVTALYEKRAERLASHLVDLRSYLPAEQLRPSSSPGP